MKYITTLIITLILSLTVFSQNVIITDTTKIALPVNIAKKIALDLISYDSLKNQYDVTQNILELNERKCMMKDTLIKSLSIENKIYSQQITLYKDKEQQYTDYNNTLKNDINKLKLKNKLTSGVGILLLVGGVIFIISKH